MEVPKGLKDIEGFIVVSKRRRRPQPFMNPINGLYSEESICTSVEGVSAFTLIRVQRI